MDEPLRFAGSIDGVLDPRQHDDLFGHDEPKRLLKLAFEHDRMPQAWLLQGPEGVGKATFAWHFARRLAEFGTLDDRALSPEMMDRFARGSQSQIYDITYPSDDKGGYKTQITIEAMRNLTEKMSLSTTEGGWRIIIIDPAEAMNSNAANALLKLLEEPPERVLFFLVSHAPHKLLPTIHSRCQKLRFQELSDEEMQTIWMKVCEDPLPEPIRFELAEGSMRMALSLDDDMTSLYAQMIAMLKRPIPRQSIAENASRIAKGSRAESLARARLLFQLLFGRMARMAAGVQAGNAVETQASQALQTQLAPWAELSQTVLHSLDDAARLNLDPEVTILNQWLAIDDYFQKL